MICYHCRKKIPDDVKYCPECGTATKLVGEAPTETIVLPPDFEELEPAPAPVKPGHKLEFPKIKKEPSEPVKAEKPPKKPEPQEPDAPKARFSLPIAAGILFAVLMIVLLFGMRGGSSGGAVSNTPASSGDVTVREPIEFTDAALWHAERGEEFAFTHTYDAQTYSGFSLQHYAQVYMDPDEAEALFEEYFNTYLVGEQGYERTGDQMLYVEGLARQYVWFEHPDETVEGFRISKMTEGLADGTCDLAYAFQGGIDGSILVSCYYSTDLTMRVGELPAPEPLAKRTEFTDPALWFAESGSADELWRIGRASVEPSSFRQEYGVTYKTARLTERELERYFSRNLTSEQDFELVGEKTYEDDELELGFYWFDYTGKKEIDGFQYKNQTANILVPDCDLMFVYCVHSDGTISLHSYYSRDLAARESDLLEIAEGAAASDTEEMDETLDPLTIPAGAVPDLNAWSGNELQLVNTVTEGTSRKMEYEWTGNWNGWTDYVELLQDSYGFRLTDWDREKQSSTTLYLYRFVYSGNANVGSFESGFESVNLLIQCQVDRNKGAIQVTCADGLRYMDTGDRIEGKRSLWGWL